MDGPRSGRPGLVEALAVWCVYGVFTIAVIVTYARIAPDELYHTSDTGLRAGFGRALVYLNYPVALAAIPLAALAAARLARRWAATLAFASALLCLVVVVPGVVDPGDLDAKAVNAVPAAGVALALAVTVVAVARRGAGDAPRALPGDRLRIVLAAAVVLVGLPWLFASFGVYIGDVPGLGSIFLSDELAPTPANPNHRVVHLGEHHGTAGLLFVLTALALTRALASFDPRRRAALALYLALMLAYGLALIADDAWGEQVVARGWVDWRIPSVLEPSVSVRWAVLLLVAAGLFVLLVRNPRRPVEAPTST